MTHISKEEIRQTATLAKLSFTEEELDAFQTKFEKIVDYVGHIDKLDLKGVEPMTHLYDYPSNTRQDVATEPLSQEEALLNAPKKSDTYFKVPKVLQQDSE
ncbi:MAG: Asp-tRNA(Asn)/Glu-tRNA(Gln) amidotransferase subunit GatC [Candidatus Kapaibacteriales bacterium]